MEAKSSFSTFGRVKNHPLLRPVWLRQMIKFSMVGAFNTCLDIGIYYILTRFFLFYYLLAKTLSFSVGVVSSFILNRRFTFRNREPAKTKQFARFWVVALGGLGLNALIVYLLVDKAHWFDLTAVIGAVFIVFFWNFLLSRFWVFRTGKGL